MWTAAIYSQLIDTLGVVASLQRVKDLANTTNNIRVGFSTISKEDIALVNAYGVGAKVITFKHSDVSGTPPAKFDLVTIGAERYVIDTVVPVHLPGGAVVGHKAYIKGHA